jgi:excisionase family DNA binding protein
MADHELVDIVKAEQLTGLARSTIYKLARKGRLRSFKVLNARRFSKVDLLALVTEEKQPGCPPEG